MNWGYKIMFTVIAFLIGMTFMVGLAMRQTIETADAHYYETELKHQDVLDANARLLALGKKATITQDDNFVTISLPVAADNDSGTVSFFFPATQKFDRTFPLLAQKQTLQLSKKEFAKGKFRVRIAWTAGGEAYFDEEQIFIR